MKQINKKTAYTLFVTVVIFVMAVFSTVSYAWLINYVHGDFGFKAGEIDPLTLQIAKISVTDPATITYTEANRAYADCANNKIETKDDGTHLDAALGNMSFGAIDNVAQLKPENVVYFRLTVPKSLGDTVKLNLRYTADDFIVLYKNVYGADGNPTGTELVQDTSNLLALENNEQVKKELGEQNSYLLFDAVVSNNVYEATQIAAIFETTSATGTEPTNTEQKFSDENYTKFVTPGVYQSDCLLQTSPLYTKSLKNPNYDVVADDGNYYVYIKVVPNLALLAYSIEYISEIMPCYMFFKVSATFEIPVVTETTPVALRS